MTDTCAHLLPRLSAPARAQLCTIGKWWLANRPKAPEPFEGEVAQRLAFLGEAPLTGAQVAMRRQGIRRLLLRKTQYHLYYTMDTEAEVVEVRAVWHTSRGKMARL